MIINGTKIPGSGALGSIPKTLENPTSITHQIKDEVTIDDQTVPDLDLTAADLRAGGKYVPGIVPSNVPLSTLQAVAGCTDLPAIITMLALMEETNRLTGRLNDYGVKPIQKPITKINLG